MAERLRVKRHRAIKRLMAATKYDEARNALMGALDSHLVLLTNPDIATDKVELFLTLDYALLAECDSLDGQFSDADMWFDKAFEFYHESHDPMVMQRLLRVRALHYARTGRIDDAIAELNEVCETLGSAAFELQSQMPDTRIELELAFTQGRLAEVRLMRDANDAAAAALALAMMPILRAGNKPRYELENLMVCIAVTNRFAAPVAFRRMVMRAWYLNTAHVHCMDRSVDLVVAELPAPFGSVVRAGANRLP